MQTITKTKNTLYNCTRCYDIGFTSMACGSSKGSVHNSIYCNCTKGRKLAVDSNSTKRRIH